MSSMRNAVARRNHKERSQPASRAKWGLLEKHKDYSLRAKDYNLKKQKLNILSAKSRERHPDEFAFGMLSADKGVQGKHGRGDQNKNKLSHDTVQLLKTQDSGYLRTVAARGRKEIERLNEEVALGLAMKKRRATINEKKIVFDEDGQPPKKKRRVSDDMSDEFDTNSVDIDDEMDDDSAAAAASPEPTSTHILPTTTNDNPDSETESTPPPPSQPKSKKQLSREQEASLRLKADKRRRKRLRERRAAKLVELQKRQKQILAAADQLELQRAKMARAIGGTNKNGVKFKIRERKR